MASMTSSDVGLLFKISADAGQAETVIKKFANSVVADTQKAGAESVSNLGRLGSAMEGLEGSAGIATIAIGAVTAAAVAVGAAAIAAGETLFNMAEKAAEAGHQLEKFQAISGFSAEAVSTLNYYAKLTGTSLDSMGIPISKFGKLMQSGVDDPSGKAAEQLKRLGVTSKDLTTAFSQATEHIKSQTSQTEKLTEATIAFGGRGVKVVMPLIEAMPGSFDNATESAKKLGQTLSEDDIKAATEFHKALTLLESQLYVAAEKFALTYAPVITDALKQISQTLAENQEVAREWGRGVSTFFSMVGTAAGGWASMIREVGNVSDTFFNTNVKGWFSWAGAVRAALAAVTLGASELYRYLNPPGLDIRAGINEKTPAVAFPSVGGGGKGGKGGGGKSDAEAKLKADLQAQVDLQELYLKQAKDKFKLAMAELMAEFEKTGNQELLGTAAATVTALFEKEVSDISAKLDPLNDKLNDAKKETPAQIELRAAKQKEKVKELVEYEIAELDKLTKASDKAEKKSEETWKKLIEDIAKASDETTKSIRDMLTQNSEDALKSAEDQYQRTMESETATKQQKLDALAELQKAQHIYYVSRMIDENDAFVNEQLHLLDWYTATAEQIETSKKNDEEKEAAIQSLNEKYERQLELLTQIHNAKVAKIESKTAKTVTPEAGPFDALIKQIDELMKRMQAVVGMKNILASIGSMAVEMFDNMAHAVGGAIEQWALYGGSVGQALKKALAAELAHIAGVAVVNALYATALGFIRLAEWDFVGAGNAFISAGIWAGLAGVSAISARAIAGDSFKQQTAASTAGSTAAQQRNTANNGQPYSSQANVVSEGGINNPMRPSVDINIHVKPSGLSDLFNIEWNRNGRLRQTVLAGI